MVGVVAVVAVVVVVVVVAVVILIVVVVPPPDITTVLHAWSHGSDWVLSRLSLGILHQHLQCALSLLGRRFTSCQMRALDM